jgi:hypothetical protein
MRTLAFALMLVVLASAAAIAQEVADTTFRVAGNCSQCKTRIEKAVSIQGVKFARWNKSTKMLKVAYQTGAVTVDSLQRRLAAVGHDTGIHTAPDAVYKDLPACCLYRDNANTH